MRARAALLLVALSSFADADRVHDRVRYTDELVDQLRRTAECRKASPPWWCRAARWSEGTADPLPIGKPLIGRSFTKGQPGQKARSPRKIDLQQDFVQAIVTGQPEHPVIKLETISDAAPELVANVTRVLDGKAPRITLDAALTTQLRALTGERSVIAVDGEWFWDQLGDDVRMRHVHGLWIAILAPPPGSARAYPDARDVFVLTDAWD